MQTSFSCCIGKYQTLVLCVTCCWQGTARVAHSQWFIYSRNIVEVIPKTIYFLYLTIFSVSKYHKNDSSNSENRSTAHSPQAVQHAWLMTSKHSHALLTSDMYLRQMMSHASSKGCIQSTLLLSSASFFQIE